MEEPTKPPDRARFLVQIEADAWCAGFTVIDGKWGVVAPIIRWATVKMSPREFVTYCRRKGYKAVFIPLGKGP